MNATNDSKGSCCNPSSQNENMEEKSTVNKQNENSKPDSDKDKHTTPVIPYTGNDMLEGGRSRLTASGDKPE